MSIVCGYMVDGVCSQGEDTCEQCLRGTYVYSGKDYDDMMWRMIAGIFLEYKEKGIKARRKRSDFNMRRAICGHCSDFEGDDDDIYYMAAVIVLLVCHQFKRCDELERREAYKIMQRLYIPLDKKMEKDRTMLEEDAEKQEKRG